MERKAILMGVATVFVIGGGYWLSQQPRTLLWPQPPSEQVTAPEQMAASNQQATREAAGMYGDTMHGDMMDDYSYPADQEPVDSCPDMAGTERLDFTGEMTDEVRSAIKAREKATQNPEFIEEGDVHLVSYVDLNANGRTDFVTMYNGVNWCGSSGCMMELYLHGEDGEYRGIPFVYGAAGTVYVTQEREEEFRKIIVAGKEGSANGTNQLWMWYRGEYRRFGNCPNIDLNAVDAAIKANAVAAE